MSIEVSVIVIGGAIAVAGIFAIVWLRRDSPERYDRHPD